VLVLFAALVACADSASLLPGPGGIRSQAIPVATLRVDARGDKRGVTIYDDHGFSIERSALLNLKNVSNAGFPGGERGLPASLRVTWYPGPLSRDVNPWTGAAFAGDYTVPVAARIPETVREFIRTNGGSLRLKIRLVDDGVLVGWDVEQRVGPGEVKTLVYRMAGGDFREDRIVNGIVVEAGWQNAPSASLRAVPAPH